MSRLYDEGFDERLQQLHEENVDQCLVGVRGLQREEKILEYFGCAPETFGELVLMDEEIKTRFTRKTTEHSAAMKKLLGTMNSNLIVEDPDKPPIDPMPISTRVDLCP